MNREQLLKTPCWSCWWREGDACFNDKLGILPVDENGLRAGFHITPEHIAQCSDGYKSKRAVLKPFFEGKQIIILSEEAAAGKEGGTNK